MLHDISSLRNWGGMLQVFASLVPHLREVPGVRQYLCARTDGMAPMARPGVEALSAPPGADYRLGPIPLPRRPALLRHLRRRALARPWGVTTVLNWGRLGNEDALALARDLRVPAVYWEHGAAWLRRRPVPSSFLDGFRGGIAVSEAARTMLVERWGFPAPVEVVPNGVWDEHRAEPAPVRDPAGGRPLRLGFAGRLVALKGAAIALHVLAALRANRFEAELHIAGDGPDAASLRGLAATLGIDGQVRWRGYVSDMEAFYRSIDVLLHPAVREPFGLIGAEAQCWGAPVVTVGVDGLPEVVEDGSTGFCVEPTLPLSEAQRIGIPAADLPALVYDPVRRQLVAPRLADPAALAAAVMRVAASLPAMSVQAAARARERFALGRQARALTRVLTA